MKALVVYDSEFGNTKQVAMAIGGVFGSQDEVEVLRVGEVKVDQIKGIDYLIVGSPTQRFRPTPATSDFLKQIPNAGLEGISATAFDTRLTIEEIEETGVLAFFVRSPSVRGSIKKGQSWLFHQRDFSLRVSKDHWWKAKSIGRKPGRGRLSNPSEKPSFSVITKNNVTFVE